MTEISNLKKEHKKLENITKKTTKKRLNDRASDSWIDLRDLKKIEERRLSPSPEQENLEQEKKDQS